MGQHDGRLQVGLLDGLDQVAHDVVRFRPLVMTALTSFIGHLPMLYATGSGADIQRPLAVVVMGGLVTSTLLTLLVLPTVYGLFAGRARRAGPP